MKNLVRFPPRYLHPERSDLGRAIVHIVQAKCGACNVDDLARMTGANPAIIDAMLDRLVAYYVEGTA